MSYGVKTMSFNCKRFTTHAFAATILSVITSLAHANHCAIQTTVGVITWPTGTYYNFQVPGHGVQAWLCINGTIYKPHVAAAAPVYQTTAPQQGVHYQYSAPATQINPCAAYQTRYYQIHYNEIPEGCLNPDFDKTDVPL